MLPFGGTYGASRLEVAQAFLGHANAKTTEIYAEVDSKKAAIAAEAIG